MYDGENLWQQTGVQYDEHSENRVNHVLGRLECMYDGENRENYEHCQYDEHSVNHEIGRLECMYDGEKWVQCSMMNTLKTV